MKSSIDELKELVLKNDKLVHVDVFQIVHFAKCCRKLLFSGYLYENEESFSEHINCVRNCLSKCIKEDDVDHFFAGLIEVRKILEIDVEAMYNGDPAASSKQEIILCYPGIEAISYYRIAHLIYKMGYSLMARVISEYAHRKTQIDIHPGATIGYGFCIDHGTGVVIGETTIIGNNVRIYQGVTLGAKWLNDARQVRDKKRHPTIGDNVIIYANATILGGKTFIKDNSIIGANAFLLEGN